MFRAEVDGRALTFELADALRGRNFVMLDKETGSRWQQATGEAFEGPLKGKRLGLYPFLLTTWQEWRRRHPDTLALVPEPGLKKRYQMAAERMEQVGPADRPVTGLLREDGRLPSHELVVGLEVGGGHKVYRVATLKREVVVNDRITGVASVLVVHDARTDTTTAFSRRLDDRVLTFRSLGSDPVELSDQETGSRWNNYGECAAGPLKGRRLDPLTPLPSFWFAWAEFHPGTEIYAGGGD